VLYARRIVDRELQELLAAQGAVLIEGPKACGKTETARQLAASEVLLDLDENARQAAALDPALVLDGDMPRLIDEWQLEPTIWNHVRRRVDQEHGKYILTGSAVPADDETRHTGAGRIARLRMRPMALFESGSSDGQVSLQALIDEEKTRARDPGLSVEDIAEEVCRGGWPGFRRLTEAQTRRALRDYLDQIRRVDINQVGQVTRDPERVRLLLRSLARNVSTRVAATTLATDTTMKDDTVRDYLAALTRLMVIEDQPAWTPHLRSRAALRTTPVRHFVDPSLAVAALATSAANLLRDINLFRLLFESLVIRDLRIYSQVFGGQVKQYRDNKDVEIDAIIETDDGRWGAFEIKLGPARIDEGAEALTRFSAKIDTARSGEPSVLAVITSHGYGYVRDDGIHVIPIGALRD
jgi:predicted AAA+ superfamily ATPase